MSQAAAVLTPIVRARALRKVYGGADQPMVALDDVDVEIEPGEMVALIGASGSGKSTLLNILGCLDRPTSGEYWLGGYDVSSLGRAAQAWVRLHYMGFVFQSFHLVAQLSALDNVTMPLAYAGVRRRERERRAMDLLERVGLADQVHRMPSQLSGGQKQRVAIARALANRPRLLLADEPTGALDSRTGAEILSLLSSVRQKDGVTIVMVTHDMSIARLADRRIRLHDGRVVAEGGEG